MLLSPRLTSLFISARSSNTIFTSIPQTCPALKNIEVYLFNDGGNHAALSSCLRNLIYLESANVVIPDMATLEHLGQLRGLTSLRARLPADLPSPSAPLPFIALKGLVLRYHIESMTHFFTKCSKTSLNDIIIALSRCPTTVALDRLHTALREGCSHTSLSSLSIDIEDDDPPATGDAYTINVQSFRILFCFVNITSIRVTSCVGFDLDDQEIKELAHAWPQIIILRLKLDPWYTDLRLRPKLSLRCLSILAEHCRALTDLEITLDATVEPDPEVKTQPVSQPALRNLDVGKSPITSPALHVAPFISAIFPHVSKLTTYRTYCENDHLDELEQHPEAIAHHRLWMEVVDQLSIPQADREVDR